MPRSAKQTRMELLQRMFDAELNGDVGTPQERLAALDAKFERERRLAIFKRLSVHAMSAVFRRIGAEPLETILEDFT